MGAQEQSRRVAEEIGALAKLDLAALTHRWRAMTGRKLPEHVPRWLALRLVAYRVQTDTFGKLDGRTTRALERIGRQQQQGGQMPTLDALGLSSRGSRTLSPGTVLVREHDGIDHHVTVLDEGFAWNGATYGSLSEVARAITGTRWNGHRFFGLKSGKTKERAE
jgi:hypothetical protein